MNVGDGLMNFFASWYLIFVLFLQFALSRLSSLLVDVLNEDVRLLVLVAFYLQYRCHGSASVRVLMWKGDTDSPAVSNTVNAAYCVC